MVVEVMGRYAGWIALSSGLAGRADAILIPEIPYSIENVAADLKRKLDDGKPYAIVVVAEGAKPRGGDVTVKSREIGRVERLGGVGETVAEQLQQLTGQESRSLVLGHLLRGGSPTAIDRNLGVCFGAGAVFALNQGMDGVMVALQPPNLKYVPLSEAIAKLSWSLRMAKWCCRPRPRYQLRRSSRPVRNGSSKLASSTSDSAAQSWRATLFQIGCENLRCPSLTRFVTLRVHLVTQ